LVLADQPIKIWVQAVPTDPCICRFHEVVGVRGPAPKDLIGERFGDGIMSATDFEMHAARVEDPKGDRVKIRDVGRVSRL
jgi:cyanate lyase